MEVSSFSLRYLVSRVPLARCQLVALLSVSRCLRSPESTWTSKGLSRPRHVLFTAASEPV